MARAKVVPKQPVLKQPFTPHHLLLPVEPLDCPLCVEPLDATDQDFYPCPCGYQVCLFCYGRLQTEYNNTCPGCRQQYSDDLEGVRQQVAKKLQQQKAESAQRSAMASSSHHPSHHPQHHTTHHGHTTHAAGRAKVAGNAAKQRAQHADPGHGHAHGRNAAAHAAADANSSLPPTASWAVASAAAGTSATTSNAEILAQQQQYQQQQQQPQEPPPPATGDESAWPSLGAAQPPQPQREPAPAHERRRSSSSSLNAMTQQRLQQRLDASRSSFESAASTHTVHSEHQQEAHNSDSDAQSGTTQDQQEGQQQQMMGRSSSGFTSVEVSTVVKGKRHDVCVHVSHAEEVTVYPEAAGLLDMLQQAVHTSKLSSTEAAVQLVQCLRKLEADSNSSKQCNWLQQVLAARGANGSLAHAAARPPAATRAPPPGFGPTPAKAAANNVSSAAHHHQQQHHELPPAGWSAAQRAQVQLHQQQQAAAQHSSETPQGSMHSVDSTSSLFSQGSSLSQSVWTDTGLPGVDLGLGAARLAGGLGAPGLPAAVPARLQMLWNGTNGAAANGLSYSNNTTTTTAAVTGPPPGFGGFAGGVGMGSRLNGTYNPLSFASMGTAQQGGSSIGLPPGFGLTAGDGAAAKQQQLQASSYQPF